MEYLEFLLESMFSPSDPLQIKIFHLIWVVLFVLTNIIWDIRSSKTKTFYLKMLREKIPTALAATTFSSGLLILLSIPQPAVAKGVLENPLALVVAGMAGVIYGLSELSPHDPRADSDQVGE